MARLLLLCGFVIAMACAPGRSTFARYPDAPAAFDRTGADPKALEIADKVFATAGGPGNWDKAKQVRWRQTITSDGKVLLDGEQAWDRWNARHYGRLHRPDVEPVVGYDLYGKFSMGFLDHGHDKHETMDEESRQKAVKSAQERFNIDTAVLCLPFLMFEPGAKLAYVGPVHDDTGKDAFDDLKITFADPLRSPIEFHAIIDRETHLIARVEMFKAGTTEKTGYILKDWTTVNGLKFAASRTNLGYAGETTAIADIAVSEPDDTLFIAPL
jgi:hypothetical protein